MFTR
jgi:hypothetical protein